MSMIHQDSQSSSDRGQISYLCPREHGYARVFSSSGGLLVTEVHLNVTPNKCENSLPHVS